MALIEKLKAIGDAIRAKTGKTDEFTLDQMVTEIEGIEGGGSGGADVEQIEANFITSGITLQEEGKNEEYQRLRLYENTKLISLCDYGFYGRGIKEIYLPNARYIGKSAFGECNLLVKANLPNLLFSENASFWNCGQLIEVNLPKLSIVSAGMFDGCASLERIDFHAVGKIESGAFQNCESLKTVILRPPSVCQILSFIAFSNTPLETGEGHFYVPSSMYESYRTVYEAELNKLMPSFFDILFRKIEDYPEICG